jgi:hypothetical protein
VHLHRHSFKLAKVAGKNAAGVIKDVVMLDGYREIEVDFTADDPGLTKTTGPILGIRFNVNHRPACPGFAEPLK